jgi:ElaA protein
MCWLWSSRRRIQTWISVDQAADHLLATDNGTLIGYARCHAPLAGKAHASFGRLVVAQKYRGTGPGEELVRRLIARLAEGSCPDVLIGAQLYLEDFYARFEITEEI